MGVYTYLPIVCQSVYFVDEDFKLYVLVDLVGPRHRLVKPDQSVPIVILEARGTVSYTAVHVCVSQTVCAVYREAAVVAAAVTWASMTKMRAPQPPNMWSESKAGSRKSIWPGKSHIYMVDIYSEGGLVSSCQLLTNAVPSLSKPLPFLPFLIHTHTHLELDEGAVADVVFDYFAGALQEEGLIGGQLVEHHLRDGRFSAPAEDMHHSHPHTITHPPHYHSHTIPTASPAQAHQHDAWLALAADAPHSSLVLPRTIAAHTHNTAM